MTATLNWVKGPALGGVGTAGIKDGVPQWRDGDMLLVLVETNHGDELHVFYISCDEGFFSVEDSYGDCPWEPECWSWYAVLKDSDLPKKEVAL